MMKRRQFIAGLGGARRRGRSRRGRSSQRCRWLARQRPIGRGRGAQRGGVPQGLRDTGYVEGQNVTVEYHWTEGQYIASRQSRPNWCAAASR